jgi:HlyD family secretion protein
MKRSVRRLPWIAAIAVLIGGGALWLLFGSGGSSKSVRFTTAIVDRGRISARITATGTLAPLKTVQVGSQVSGRIQEIFVDYNSAVSKGQVIAKIEPQIFEAAVEQANANLDAAQANLVKAKAWAKEADLQLVRLSGLAGDRLVAQADVDTAQANAEVARSQVVAAGSAIVQARAALHQAELNVAYTTIRSPIDGMVISRSVDVGQTVASMFQTPTLVTIAEDLKQMQVDTSVAEGDVGKVESGMKVTFTVDAYPTESFTGAVRLVRNSPQTVQNVVTYNAVIDVANPGLKLKPGMTANVSFILTEKEDVLRVTNAALRFRLTGGLRDAKVPPNPERGPPMVGDPEQAAGQSPRPAPQDLRVVYVLLEDEPMPAQIRIGITDGTFTELVAGDLKPGDALITATTGGKLVPSTNRPMGMPPGGPPPGPPPG